MKFNALISSVLFSGTLLATTPAHALNDGALDSTTTGKWFNTRILLTIAKNRSVDNNPQPGRLVPYKIKFDTGKNRCFSGLTWQGEGSYAYHLITVCQDPTNNDTWSYVETTYMNELADGNLGFRYGSNLILYPKTVKTGYEWDQELAGYYGGLLFGVKYKKDGSLKNIKWLNKKGGGTVFYQDEPNGISGSSNSGLRLNLVAEKNVPAGALACLADIFNATNTIAECGGSVD